MPIMNLLVAFNGSTASENALRYAASMARSRQANVTATLAHAAHEAIDRSSRWIPSEAKTLLAEAQNTVLSGIRARFAEVAPQLGLGDALKLQDHEGRVDATLAEAARYYDMIIVGQPAKSDNAHVALHPDRIALLSGRPVVVVPEVFDAEANHNHAALAWDGSRAAARALSDSLRLLEDEGRVSVLTVGHRSDWPISDLMTHLSRHDIDGIHENFPETHPVAETLLAYCQRNDPSLLVMGAYEHSKFREDFLGGVTASVLRGSPIPVLLSH